jgi:hypothetical protein
VHVASLRCLHADSAVTCSKSPQHHTHTISLQHIHLCVRIAAHRVANGCEVLSLHAHTMLYTTCQSVHALYAHMCTTYARKGACHCTQQQLAVRLQQWPRAVAPAMPRTKSIHSSNFATHAYQQGGRAIAARASAAALYMCAELHYCYYCCYCY